MVRNIMVITDSIDVDDSSGSKANVALIKNLALCGYEVTVFHYSRREINLPSSKCFEVTEIKFSFLYLLSRTQRVLQRNSKVNLAPFLERVFGFSFTFYNDTQSITRALNDYREEPDLVITLSKGASFRPHYALLSLKKWHSKWVAYIHDPYPFHFYPRPYNWVEPGFRKKEAFFRKVSKSAAYSAFPSLLLKQWMGSYFPDFLHNGLVIPHQVNNTLVSEQSIPDYFDPLKFNVLHAGNLMKQRSPLALIKGFLLFLDENTGAKSNSSLLLLGPASYHANVLSDYDALREIYIENRKVDFDVILNLQKHASVNVILESISEISPFLPAKFAHCVYADVPILLLSPHYSESRRLLGDDYPYYSEADDVPLIASNLEKLYRIWESGRNNLKLNRPDLAYYLSHKSLKNQIDSILR